MHPLKSTSTHAAVEKPVEAAFEPTLCEVGQDIVACGDEGPVLQWVASLISHSSCPLSTQHQQRCRSLPVCSQSVAKQKDWACKFPGDS